MDAMGYSASIICTIAKLKYAVSLLLILPDHENYVPTIEETNHIQGGATMSRTKSHKALLQGNPDIYRRSNLKHLTFSSHSSMVGKWLNVQKTSFGWYPYSTETCFGLDDGWSKGQAKHMSDFHKP